MALLQIKEPEKGRVQEVISSICASFVETTERQLSDFLPGGRYHAVTDPVVLAKLQHSHVTNLLGEACFGDLDISIYTRRNTSVHHHSTLNMLKRNRTMSEWFVSKSANEQLRLLQMAAGKAPMLRKRHQEHHQDVVAAKRLRLEDHQRKQEEDNENKARLKAAIILEVRQHQGPCMSVADVDRVLTTLQLQRDKAHAMKTEIRYFKIVLGFRSPHLKLTQDLPNLVQSLKNFLEEENPFPASDAPLSSFDLAIQADTCEPQ